MAAQQQAIPAEAQFLVVNGLIYDVKDFSVYGLMETLQREVRVRLVCLWSPGV